MPRCGMLEDWVFVSYDQGDVESEESQSLTLRLNTMTLYCFARESSSTMVFPIPPVPPATATVIMMNEKTDVKYDCEFACTKKII
jgi:hypothetical protein